MPDRRKPANSVSAVSHFWAFLFFLDLLCFYELKLVFDGDIDSGISLENPEHIYLYPSLIQSIEQNVFKCKPSGAQKGFKSL